MNTYLRQYLRRTKLYKQIFNTPEGQDVLKFLAVEAGAYGMSFVPNDPYSTAFNEGKRQMYSHIIGVLNQNEDLLRRAVQQEQESNQLATMMNNIDEREF